VRSTYNPDGTLASSIDAAGAVTTYTYDARGRVVASTDPDGRTSTTGYDAVNRPVTVQSPSGAVTTTSYDADGRTVAIAYSDGHTPNVAMSYDPAGRRVSMTDGTGVSSWSYDVFGELTSQSNGAGSTVGYAYDDGGNRTSITYPGAIGSVTNAYNAGGQLASVKDPAGRKTSFGYNPDGALTTTTYPNGTVVTNSYNAADQQTATTLNKGSTVLGALTYGRDTLGQLSSQTPSGGLSGSARTFSYTPLQQVSSAVSGSATSNYAYDAADHLTSNATTTQAYDPAGRLCWSAAVPVTGSATCDAAPAGSTRYGYDADGRRTAITPPTGTATAYTYDQTGQLASATTPAGSGSYTYDGDGRRASKTVGGATTRYTYSGPTLLSDGATYIYGPGGLPIEQIKGSTVSYYVHDHLGSTVALTDSAGAIAATYAYDVYGKVTEKTGSVDTPLQYGLGYTDAESGLVYLSARYYDPATGQFLSVDPMVATTMSAYGYADGNPLNAVDPTGLCSTWCWIGIGAAVVAVGVLTMGVGTAGIMAAGTAFVEAGGIEVAGGLITAGGAIGAAASSRGGRGPVEKGQAGVARSEAAATARGETVIGREVTVDTSGGRTRIDLVVRKPDGSLLFIEAKNGQHAGLTRNQKTAFPAIESEGCTPMGQNAANAGLKPGVHIPATPVQVDRWGK
jgi:RHS repeat-associated protein